MLDFILTSGDQAIFNPTFAKAIVAVRPGILTGTGRATVNNKKICIYGDEKKVIVLVVLIQVRRISLPVQEYFPFNP